MCVGDDRKEEVLSLSSWGNVPKEEDSPGTKTKVTTKPKVLRRKRVKKKIK